MSTTPLRNSSRLNAELNAAAEEAFSFSPKTPALDAAEGTPRRGRGRQNKWRQEQTKETIKAANGKLKAKHAFAASMHTLAKVDAEQSMEHEAVKLGAMVRIYSMRVDNTERTEIDLMSNLHRTKATPRKKRGGNAAGGEDAAKPKKKVAAPSTMVSAESLCLKSALRAKVDVDPIFHRLAETFDAGGAQGMLMNHLAVTNGCSISICAAEDAAPPSALTPVAPAAAAAAAAAAPLNDAPIAFELGISTETLAELSVCPDLEQLYAIVGVARAPSARSTPRAATSTPPSPPADGDAAAAAEDAAAALSDNGGADEGGWGDDDDVWSDNDEEMFADFGCGGGGDDDAASVAMEEEGDEADGDDATDASPEAESALDAPDAAAVREPLRLRDIETMIRERSSQAGDGGARNQSWGLPRRRSARAKKADAGAELTEEQAALAAQGAAAKKAKKTALSFAAVLTANQAQFAAEVTAVLARTLKKPKKSRKSKKDLTKDAASAAANMLPSALISSETYDKISLTRPFLNPRVRFDRSPDVSHVEGEGGGGSVAVGDEGDGEMDYDDGDRGNTPRDAAVSSASSSAAVAPMPFSRMLSVRDDKRAMMFFHSQDIETDYLVPREAQVEHIDIKFTATHKRVDVASLKEKLQASIDTNVGPAAKAARAAAVAEGNVESKLDGDDESVDAELARESGGTFKFSDAMSEIVDTVPGDVTVPFYFICVLHLANEHGLELEGHPDLKNFTIAHN